MVKKFFPVQTYEILNIYSCRGGLIPRPSGRLRGIKHPSATTSGEQHTSPFRARLLIKNYFYSGMVIVKQVSTTVSPMFCPDVTAIDQPWEMTTHFTIDKPRPIPSSRRDELPR
jgi:hypothetical protein